MERVSVTRLDDDDRRWVVAWVLPLLGVLRDREHVLSVVRGVEDPALLWTDERLAVLADVCVRLAGRLGEQACPEFWQAGDPDLPHVDALMAMRQREADAVSEFAVRAVAHLER